MDISTKTCLLLALSEHSKLMNRYIVHTSEEFEEQKKRTRYCFCLLNRFINDKVLNCFFSSINNASVYECM